MRWLKRDEGVTMVLVGVMLSVLLAVAGMAVDLGVVFAERRELRTGADAGALAIAEDCGMKHCDEPTARATAQEYADANAWDGTSAVDSVSLIHNTATTGSVRVVTSAWDAAKGESGVRVPLLSLLGFDRVSVGASATAIFDHPASGQALPLVVERYCMQELGTSAGYLIFHTATAAGTGSGSCRGTEPAGQDAPGAFGWVDVDLSLAPDLVLGDCQALFYIGTWGTFTDPGHGAGAPPRECEAATIEQGIYQQVVMIPVYSQVRDQGNNSDYLIDGFAAFFVEGYRLGNRVGFFLKPPGGGWDNSICGNREMCLYGHFTSMTVYTGEPGGPDYGVSLVKLVD
jgi:hypothetical protein